MSRTSTMWVAAGMVAITAGYGLFEARTLLQGPVLIVTSPRRGETLTDTMLHIEGSAEHVTRVLVNGRPVTLDLAGTFSEKLLTPEGYWVVLVEAEDRFGKRVKERIEVVGKPGLTAEQGEGV